MESIGRPVFVVHAAKYHSTLTVSTPVDQPKRQHYENGLWDGWDERSARVTSREQGDKILREKDKDQEQDGVTLKRTQRQQHIEE